MSAAPSIQISQAHLDYQGCVLFDQLSFALPAGKWSCLLGPSGVGKSSLLRLIAGLKTWAISALISTSDHLPLQGRLAYLAQNEILLPWLNAVDNVMIGSTLRGEKNTYQRQRAKELLKRVGIENKFSAFPKQLSGGMKQRVLLARTLFEDKPVILLDEPFAAVDVLTRTTIQELAAELLQDRTVLLVTHDPLEALRLGHHIYVMSGSPVTVTSPGILTTATPRRVTDPDLLRLQAELLDHLAHAKEVTTC